MGGELKERGVLQDRDIRRLSSREIICEKLGGEHQNKKSNREIRVQQITRAHHQGGVTHAEEDG